MGNGCCLDKPLYSPFPPSQPTSQTKPAAALSTCRRGFIRGFHAMHEAEQESIVSAFQFSVRIAGHILEYMILGMLCTAALFQYELSFKKRFFISACICLLYAVSDEVHQLFVPGRSCQISDIGFDFLGSVLGSLAISGLGSIVKKRHKKASDPINPSARSSASAVKIKKQP